MAKKTESVPVKSEEGRGVSERVLEPLASLRDEIDHLFDEFHSGWPFGPSRRRLRGWMEPFRGTPLGWGLRTPAVDMVDKEKEIQLKAELPGMDEGDIEVRLSDGMLTISGEKKEEREEGEKEGDYYVSERRYGTFQRSFPLPEGIDQDKVAATFQKGVLTVTLPKTPETQKKSKKIAVKGKA